MKKDDLGDRMKRYESHDCERRFIEGLPIYARIDGRSFSKFTKGMGRPYDIRLTNALIDVTKALVRETHATIGYIQSDEISLAWINCGLFDRKSHKLHSVLASLAASAFANALVEYFDD
jgi:tRNA(His) 5'-end guanylyltransferase